MWTTLWFAAREASESRSLPSSSTSASFALREQFCIAGAQGGAEYARSSAEEFSVADCFTAFLPKPNVFIDDQSATEWPRSISVHPSSCAGRSLDDYKRLLI